MQEVVMMLKGANSNEVVQRVKEKFLPFRNRFRMMLIEPFWIEQIW
jgi:Cu/Ag efflux pump CusA